MASIWHRTTIAFVCHLMRLRDEFFTSSNEQAKQAKQQANEEMIYQNEASKMPSDERTDGPGNLVQCSQPFSGINCGLPWIVEGGKLGSLLCA